MRHLRAYLVRAPRQQPALHERELTLTAQHAVLRYRGLAARLGLILYKDLVLLCVLEQIVLKPPGSGARPAGYGTEIELLNLSVTYFLVEDAQRLGIFCRNDDAAGVAVDAVAERRGEGVFFLGLPFTLLRHVRLNIRDKRVIIPSTGAVAQHARLFVQQQDVFILVDDRQPRGADLEIGVLLTRLFKELVVYI